MLLALSVELAQLQMDKVSCLFSVGTVQLRQMAPPTNHPQKSSSDKKLHHRSYPHPWLTGQRPLCSGDVQAAAGGLEEPGAPGTGGGSHPEGFAPGGACHNPGQDVRRLAGTLVKFTLVSSTDIQMCNMDYSFFCRLQILKGVLL